MKRSTSLATVLVTLFYSLTVFSANNLTDDQIRDLMIKESIQQYKNPCPCPYNIDKAGNKCDGRSAYIKSGGKEPHCFRNDITPEMVKQYREHLHIP